MKNMKIFADRLKIARKAANLTQKQMAAELSVAERNYQRYESGETEPNFTDLCFIARRLNVSADYLLGLKEE